MARQRDVDWSDWKGYAEQPEHRLSRPLDPSLKKGADVVREALSTGHLPETFGKPKPQPTNKELFGHLEVTEEMAKKAEEKWLNTFKTLAFRGKVDHLNKPNVDVKWGYGKSYNQLLKEQISEKEMAERNTFVGE